MTINGRVTAILPARNERFLQRTIDSVLSGATGDVEVIPILDGYVPDPPLVEDPRVKPLAFAEPQGMRPGENAAAQRATGEFLLKLDAHCLLAEGWDASLKDACEPGSLVVPTRHSIDPLTWTMKPRHWNYSILTYPFKASMYGEGFHAVTFPWDQNKVINQQRAHVPVDDLLSAQGSCWFQRTADFLADGPLNHEALYFYAESQEVFLRILARGGRCLIDKRTWYAHYHKGNNNLHTQDGRIGRGFFLDLKKKRKTEATIVDWCLNGWPWAKVRTFESIIEQHWWLISQMQDPRYAWPEDWRDWEKYWKAFESRPPEAIPAHI